MQFETRIINGKPSIFYKDDTPKTSQGKKINTKNKLARNDIRKSMEISGESDMVKPSPRHPDSKTNSKNPTSINSILNKNGINLTPDQLIALVKAIQTNDLSSNLKSSKNNSSVENLNFNDEDIKPNRIAARTNLKQIDDINMNVYKQPQIVIAEEDVPINQFQNILKDKSSSLEQLNSFNINNSQNNNNKTSLIEKKKLKWLQDKEIVDKLTQQEVYDAQKINNQINSKQTPEPPIANTNVFKNTMSLAEKKRLQWQQERDNNKEDMSKFHNSTNDLVNYQKRSAENQNQFIANNNFQNDSNQNSLRKANSLNNINQFSSVNDQNINTSTTEINQIQQSRQSLIEKKKQKWVQEKEASNEHWPYGKPGPGAGRSNPTEVDSLPPQPPSQNYNNSKLKNKKESREEFNRIKQQIEEITAAENKIKQEQIMLANNQQTQPQPTYHDQSKVPAAMRTSILFGGVLFDDNIKKTRELERKKWLQDLEEQKKEKLIESQRGLQTTNQSTNIYSNINASQLSTINDQNITNLLNSNNLSNATHENEKSFGRTRNLLDPAQVEEIERKKRQNLLHKQEIEAQIAEKKRVKLLEEEIQALNNLKIENEAKEIKQLNEINQEMRKHQTQYHNFEKILNSSRQNEKADFVPSVLQGEVNKYDQDSKSVRNNITETRSQEIYRKMQEAELAAAEEKHKKLLKRLKKGGHDTTQLERKFAELKARLTGNPSNVLTENYSNMSTHQPSHQISNVPGLNFNTIESNRNSNNMSQLSVMSEHEQRLERQKQLLANKLANKENEAQVNNQNAKIKRIFQLLREDTSGLPAEITEEDLKNLLKNVVKDDNSSNKKEQTKKTKEVQTATNKKQINKEQSQQQDEQEPPKGIGKDGKPIWNYKNLAGRKAIPNSMKDPFYNEKAKKIDERRRQRMDYYQNLADKNSNKYKEFINRSKNNQKNTSDTQIDNYSINDYQQNTDTTDRYMNRQNLASSMSNTSTDYKRQVPGTSKQQTESILNLLTKNLAANPIYEEDEDLYLNKTNQNHQNQLLQFNNASNSSFEDGLSNRGFVPFMRTNEVLDPVHADSPIPPSRESSAVKRDREKARQAYIQNMRPSEYGNSYDEITNRNRSKDPLINPGLVRNNPTPRQEQILSQLANLKQSLIQKQKEIASSISYDNVDNYD